MAEELVQAQEHLDAEEDELALKVVGTAIEKFREASNNDGLADALLVEVSVRIAKDMRKSANKVAQDALETFTDAGHMAGQAKMELAIAETNSSHRGRENREKALEAAKHAIDMFDKLDDKRMKARACIVTANISISRGESEEAASIAMTAKGLSRSVGDKRGEGVAHHCIAVIFSKAENEAQKCIQACKAALDCFQAAGLKHLEAFEQLCLAKWTSEVEKKPAKALQLALKCQKFCRSNGCPEHRALAMVVGCYIAQGSHDTSAVGKTLMFSKAERAAQQALLHFQAEANNVGQAHALQSLATSQRSLGKLEQAASAANSAARLFCLLGDTESEVEMLQSVSSLLSKVSGKESAKQATTAAENMFTKAQTAAGKVSALEALFNAHMAGKAYGKAKDAAKKISDISRQGRNKQQQGKAYLLMCDALLKSQDMVSAGSIAKDAQKLLKEAGDIVGEAKALRTGAKIHFFKGQYELAQRTALRERELMRVVSDPQSEGDSALLLANIRLQMLYQFDDKTTNEAFTNHFYDIIDAAKYAKWIGLKYGEQKLVACSLKIMAEAYARVNEIPECLKLAQEAGAIFRELDEQSSLAYLLLIEAEAWYAGGQEAAANKAARSAMKTFQDRGDAYGIAKTQDVQERINPPTPPPEKVQEVYQPEAPAAVMAWQPQTQAQPEYATEEIGNVMGDYVPYTKKQLGTVNINKIDEELLRATLYNVVQDVVGYEIDDLEDDLPLMQAGIASRSAVTLRASLEEEIKGVNFPSTVVFDFPTITAITEYIMETV